MAAIVARVPESPGLGEAVVLATLQQALTLVIRVTIPLALATHPALLCTAAPLPAPAGHREHCSSLTDHHHPGGLPHPGVLQKGELGHLATLALIVKLKGITVASLGLSVLAHGSAGEDCHALSGFYSGVIPAT